MVKAKIYMQDNCRFCERAKELLQLRGIEFNEINITGDVDRKREMVDKSGRNTTPQIFAFTPNSEQMAHIGGCDDLFALDKNGQLIEEILAIVNKKA